MGHVTGMLFFCVVDRRVWGGEIDGSKGEGNVFADNAEDRGGEDEGLLASRHNCDILRPLFCYIFSLFTTHFSASLRLNDESLLRRSSAGLDLALLRQC